MYNLLDSIFNPLKYKTMAMAIAPGTGGTPTPTAWDGQVIQSHLRPYFLCRYDAIQ